MKCPNCGHRNPDGVRKCKACGKKMGLTKREKKALLIGMLLIVLILVGGIVALFMISRHFETAEVPAAQSARPSIIASSQQQSTGTATQVTPTEEPTPEPEVTPEVTEEPEPTDTTPTASVIDKGAAELNRYTKAGITASRETSYIDDPKYDNSSKAMYDGLNYTAWQENVGGSGEGETASLDLDRMYEVRYIVFKLGNWTDEANYRENNRPKTLTLQVGNQTFEVEFPDEMKEFCVDLSKEISAAQIDITLGTVYSGSVYDDTCIAEVEVYGA